MGELINSIYLLINQYRSNRRGGKTVEKGNLNEQGDPFQLAKPSFSAFSGVFFLQTGVWKVCGKRQNSPPVLKKALFPSKQPDFLQKSSCFLHHFHVFKLILSTEIGSYPQVIPGYPQVFLRGYPASRFR